MCPEESGVLEHKREEGQQAQGSGRQAWPEQAGWHIECARLQDCWKPSRWALCVSVGLLTSATSGLKL